MRCRIFNADVVALQQALQTMPHTAASALSTPGDLRQLLEMCAYALLLIVPEEGRRWWCHDCHDAQEAKAGAAKREALGPQARLMGCHDEEQGCSKIR